MCFPCRIISNPAFRKARTASRWLTPGIRGTATPARQLRGHLETMILSALERSEAHGLEILRRLEEAGCGLLRLKEGSLYPALYRLEEATKIEAAWEEQGHGRRGARRRIYRLTRLGKQ